MRHDQRRSSDSLLDAAADLVRDGEGLSMPAIASRADVGLSTAWRHFSSIDNLMRAYTRRHVEELRAFVSRHYVAPDLLALTLERWVQIVLSHGAALVEFRSRSGYIRRLHKEDEIISLAVEAWRPGLLRMLDEAAIPRSAIQPALYLTNALTDPRDIRDLHEAAFLSVDEITRKLHSAICGAVQAWTT